MTNTCVASTDRDLTTTAKLKALVLGATATSTVQDGYFSDLIRRASDWAESYVGYPLTVQTYQEMVAGFGSRRLMLERTPLRAVDRVFDATDTGTATQVLTSEFRVEHRDAGFLSRDRGWAWTANGNTLWHSESAFPLGLDPAAGEEYKPWLVDYRAGWTYAGVDTGSANWSTEAGTTSTGRTLPDDVEQAVLLKASALHEDSEEVVMEQLGDVRVQYQSAGVDRAGNPVLSAWEKLLAPYRRQK